MFRLSTRANRWIKHLIVLVLAGSVFFVTASWLFANSSYFSRKGHFVEQPIAFPHELHVNQLGLDCRFCHTQVDKDSHAGIPSMETCYGCHREILSQTDFLKPVRDAYQNKKALPWKRVNNLADHVYFHHAGHIRAGVACESCHGDVAHQPLIAKEKPLTMEWCLSCHKNQNEPLRQKLMDCSTCHR
jgi:hypothetical protein